MVSLEEAFDERRESIRHLNEQIEEARSQLATELRYSRERDEVAAVYLYLNREHKKALYHSIEKAWASNNPQKMKPWLSYFMLLKRAMDKQPLATAEVWQAIPDSDEMRKRLKSKQLFTCMSLATLSLEEAQQDAQPAPSKTVFVRYVSVGARVVTDCWLAPKLGKSPSAQSKDEATGQGEALIWPGIRLTIAAWEEDAVSGHCTVTLRPVERPRKCKCF